MKKIFVLFGFLIGISVLAGPMMSIAQMEQPDQQQGQPGRDLNQQQPDPGMGSQQPDQGMEPDEGMGGTQGSPMIPTRGTVSGEVMNVDPPTGLIEIRTDEGLVNIFTVEGEAKEQLNQVQRGDQVDLVVVLNAVELIPQETPGGTPEMPPAG